MATTKIEKPANQSVTKILQVMAILADSKTLMRLQDVAVGVNMPQATCLRYLNALIKEGYVFQDYDSGRYSLTWGVCNLGEKVRAHQSIRTLSSDIVSKLSAELELGICLVVEHDMECMYLDCLYEPTSEGAALMRIGKQTPLHASSSGKILLTEYSDAALEKLVEEKGLCSLTDKTITTKGALVQELDFVRKQGYALDNEECEEGLRCVAVPVYDYTGKAVVAISAFGSIERVTDEAIKKEILPELQAAAKALSFRMGNSFA